MRVKPTIVLDIANTVVRRLSPLVRQCDYALDWIFLESGRAVYRQDEIGDSTYIVLSGRLRSVVTQANGKKEIVGEYGKGDMVGIVSKIYFYILDNFDHNGKVNDKGRLYCGVTSISRQGQRSLLFIIWSEA